MAIASPLKKIWLLAILVTLTGGWMAFDGAHALIHGDFVTPTSGEYAGQLGPWARIPRGAGLDPRSTEIKLGFLLFGIGYLAALGAFLFRLPAARPLLLSFAAVALLYLPFGTLTSLVVLTLLISLRSHAKGQMSS